MKAVTDARTLEQAIREASEDPEAISATYSFSKAWFGVERGGKFLLAPLKLVAFHGMTTAQRRAFAREKFDARVAEKRLNAFAVPVEPSSPSYAAARDALDALGARLGKLPNALARISVVPSRVEPSEKADPLPHLLASVYLSLSPTQQRTFRRLVRSAKE